MKQKAKLFFLNLEPQYSKNMSIKLEFRTYEKYMSWGGVRVLKAGSFSVHMISEMLCFSSELLLVDSVGFIPGLSVFDFLLIDFLYIFNDINALKELKLKF